MNFAIRHYDCCVHLQSGAHDVEGVSEQSCGEAAQGGRHALDQQVGTTGGQQPV